MDDALGFLAELIFGVPGFLWHASSRLEEEKRREREQARLAAPSTAVVHATPPRVVLPDAVPSAQYVGPVFVAGLPKGARCRVCGEGLATRVVACRDCATLHHEECWDYNRGCSTYGCRANARAPS